MKTWKKILSTLLVCCLLIPMMGTAFADEEVTTLQLFRSNSTPIVGTVEYWVGDIIKEDVGVQVDALAGGKEKLQALMASGELPDIVMFETTKQLEDAINAGLLLNLDEHIDKLPNIQKNAGNMLANFRDNMSAGTGSLYAVGTHILDSVPTRGTLNWGPYVRWDLYKQAGMPEIKTLEDFIPLMQKMTELYPKTEDGKKVYSLSLWSDWDGYYMSFLKQFCALYGRDFLDYMEVDVENRTVKSMFDDDSVAMRGLRFLYEANQAGLVDPDSMTQTYSDYVEKVKQQRTNFGFWGWSIINENALEAQGIGFQPIPITDSKVLYHALRPTGMEWTYAISKDTKHVDEALALIDYMYSNKGLMKLGNGPQGIVWDLNEENKPYITKQGWDIIRNKNGEMPGGGLLSDGFDKPFYKGLDLRMINSDYGVAFDRNMWAKTADAPEETELMKIWQKDMDALDQMDYMLKHDKVAVKPLTIPKPVSDEMTLLNQRIGEDVAAMCWKCIFAKDDAEYEALKTRMIEDMYGKGLQESLDYTTAQYKETIELGQKYSGK